METIAFFLSTLSLAVTASSNPSAVFKQLLALVLGLAVFLVLGIFLRDLTRVGKIRWLMAAAAMTLMSATLVLGVAPPVRRGQLDSPGRPVHPALGAGENLLYLRRGRPPWSGCSAGATCGCSFCSPASAWAAWP